ncbi:Uncharacterized protein SCG7086_AJ_00130 [Chlamydiales bacterium SCGC AG-110-P3]|nr:Uncharacterized protein SCG7086_AJ_00130 [Chlamydiales bacterium SCGC AG-110-P3]
MSTQEFAKTVAVVGAGYWGKNLVRNMYELGALSTVCDVNESLLDKHSEQCPGISVTTNFKSVLQDPAIQQVVIATPGHTHFPLAKQALEAGKDLYVEKPLCLSAQEGRELVELAQKHGRILMVGHILQYHPCVQMLQQMLQDGQLGKLQHVVSNRLNLGKIQTKESALWALAPHDISVILSLCGNQLPEQLRCLGGDYLSDGVADVTMTTMRFPDKVQAHIYVSWLNPFKEQKLVLIGSKGMLVFDDTKDWEHKLVLYRDPVTWTHGNRPIENRGEGEYIKVEFKEPLKEECRHFLSCCITRETPKTSGSEGLRVLQVLQAAEASLHEDGECKIPAHDHPSITAEAAGSIHPSAVIDQGAMIGSGTKVWHFSHIMSGAEIGASCNIGQNVVVSPGVVLGRNCKVQNNVSIYTGVECEDDVFLGPSMVFTNIHNPRAEVIRRDQYRTTLVKKGATIGANSTILCGITLGEYSFIGAGAVVTKDVKAFALVLGNPGRQIGWMSRHGERLDLPVSAVDGVVLEAECPVTKEHYRLEGDTLVAVQPVPVRQGRKKKASVLTS